MRNKGFKILLGSVAAGAAAITFTATTFAFVAISSNVYVNDFDFNVTGYEGLLVSIDGKNFSQDITSEQLKKHIAGSVDEFNKIELQGVTLSDGKTSNINYEEDVDLSSTIEQLGTYAMFYYDEVDTVARKHNLKNAKVNQDYIAFNLWFKVTNTKSDATKYNLRFNEKTKISAKDEEIQIFNTFTADKTYNPGDTVIQNLANAARLGVYADQELSIYEVVDDKDLGSAAIQGSNELNHMPSLSVMYQYYNTLFPFYPFATAAKDGKAFETKSKYGEVQFVDGKNQFIGETITEIDLSDAEPKKVTFYIWLEGWDSDYLPGTSATASALSVDLDFIISPKSN